MSSNLYIVYCLLYFSIQNTMKVILWPNFLHVVEHKFKFVSKKVSDFLNLFAIAKLFLHIGAYTPES